uniref:Charged multivesicular body protein 6 n=1 Tax=Nomascus leucogenys TaxID=61853 RepID=A0A2I3HHE5_NOMLE
QLKQQRDKLRQYQKRITQQLEHERALARQLLRDGRKERAKLLLKKKRYQEQLLDRTENQISSLEAMVGSDLRVGCSTGWELIPPQVMSIEEVERILDETQEAVEYQRVDLSPAHSLTLCFLQEQIELPEVPSEPLPEKVPGISMFGSSEWLEFAEEQWTLEGNKTESLLPGCVARGHVCLAVGLGLGFPGVG